MSSPTVPGAVATTGQPPEGAAAVGYDTMPVTGWSRWSASIEWYMTRTVVIPSAELTGWMRMSCPGLPAGSGDGGS